MLKMMLMLTMVLMVPFVESWCTSTISFSGLALNFRHQPQRRRSGLVTNMNIRGSRPILTRRQAKQERRPTDDDENKDVKGVKKQDTNEESPGWLRSVGNVFSFSKSSSKDKPSVGKGKNSNSSSDKEKDLSSPTTSWWPQLRRKSAPEAEEKTSLSVASRRPSQAKVSPPPSVDRAKEGIRRDKKVTVSKQKITATKQETKTDKDRNGGDNDDKKLFRFPPLIMQQQGSSEAVRKNVTSIESPSLASRFQSLLNTTMPWNQPPQQNSASSNTTENPVSVVVKFFGSVASDSMQQLKNKSDQDWGPYLSNAQKSVFDAASGGMKRFTKSSATEEWIPVFPKTRISPGEMVPVTIADTDLLVIASSDGRNLYCIANSCPHLGTPLETGMLQRRPIETSSKMSPLSTKILATKSSSSSSTSSTSTDPTTGYDAPPLLSELEVMKLLQQDGCEDCIVCPLHQTAFALESGQVRGEWCPYPPLIGKIMGTVNAANPAAVFDIRYKGKNVEVRLNTPPPAEEGSKK
jgi:nitrite reductase/ring-hydroxylating ferredoxin subunit/Tfp pilus assembly protein PilV